MEALMAADAIIHKSTVRFNGEEEKTSYPVDFPTSFPVKHKKSSEREILKDFLVSLVCRKHRFFMLERQERWRAEERAQRVAFQNAMILVTKKLVAKACRATPLQKSLKNHFPTTFSDKKAVLKLIKARSEMAFRFDRCSRRAALWSELSDKLFLRVKRERRKTESPYFQELLAMAKISEPLPPLPCTELEKSRFFRA
ncbi:hypothetical protein AMTRI_Chr08g162350 [Amborella trichopoda]